MKVDPRACGVDAIIRDYWDTVRGGSPRMRGRLAAAVECFGYSRWIPAHAG